VKCDGGCEEKLNSEKLDKRSWIKRRKGGKEEIIKKL
jgi:hypothetical protein